MKTKTELASPFGKVTVHRNEHGITVIRAETMPALFFGQGRVHMQDRQIQTLLMKAIFSGRLSELLKADDASLQVDVYMRRYGFTIEPEAEWRKLPERHREYMTAYFAGVNSWFEGRQPVWEMRLAGWRHEPWGWRDTLAIGRGFGFIGLGDGQASFERFLTDMLKEGTSLEALKELFPSIDDPDFSDIYRQLVDGPLFFPESVRWLKQAPAFRSSNNWVVGPARSTSGHAIMAGDPHLDIDRTPAIWRETVLSCGDLCFIGADLPGVPGGILGRTRALSWSPTYSYIDGVDYRIEECRGGKYRRGNEWKTFARRTEEILVKGVEPACHTFHENENGILFGDPGRDGFHLIENYAALRGCGASDFEGIFGLLEAGDVRQGMACLAQLRAASFNWLLADNAGNIGYQMSGRHFERPKGTSGLLPLPAWEERYAYRGIVEGERLPHAYNPPEGFLVTANDDRNAYGTTRPCTICVGPYRKDRITALLESRSKWNARDMGNIQTDLYSLQAEAYLKRFAALIPDSPGGRLLREWDRCYDRASRGAVVFDRFYRALVRGTFGKLRWGGEPMDYLMDRTGVFNMFFHNFDQVLLGGGGRWFSGREIEKAAAAALEEACTAPFPRLNRTRRQRLGHLLFAGVFPSFLGFDSGPAFFPGSRATVCQGQFFKSGDRPVTFCPSYRFITDMGADHAFTSLPGGATDRRFSRYYKNELKRYLKGGYKKLWFDDSDDGRGI